MILEAMTDTSVQGNTAEPAISSPALPTQTRRAATARAAAARPGWLLAIVLTGQFMAILDVTIVNVAAPTIRSSLHTSGAGLQLVISGYTIAYAMLLITGARLGDLAGHRKIFQIGLTLFTLASLACGLAVSTGWLVTFRLVQGAGAALMVPQVLSLIQRTFQGAARARALSVYGAVIACAAVIGQVVGGALVTGDVFGTEWRPVFLVNVPIGAALLLLGHRVLPADTGHRSRGLDLPGLVTLSTAVCLFVVPLVLGHEQGWPLWGWVALAASVLVFWLFVRLEGALTRRGGSPLVPARVLRAPGMVPAAVALFAGMATYGGFLFTLALHLQSGLGFSPLHAGLTFIPGAAGFAFASLSWRRVPAAWHPALAPAGYTVAAFSYVALGVALRNGADGGLALGAALAGIGIGLGAAFSPLLTVALTYVAPADAADASGLLVTLVQLGQVVGVATFGTLFLTLVTHPRVHPSAHAEATTAGVLAFVAVIAATAGLALVRRRSQVVREAA
jgi:MFS family permease